MSLSILDAFRGFNPLNLKIIAGFVALTLLLSGAIWFQYKQNQSLNKTIGALEQNVSGLTTTVQTHEAAQVKMKELISKLETANQDIKNTLARNRNQIASLRKEQEQEKALTPAQQQKAINTRYQTTLGCIEKITAGEGPCAK